jgi:hypothetical protein
MFSSRRLAVLAVALPAASLVLLGAAAASDAASPTAVADESIVQVSDDPFTNPTSQHHTEVEPDTFAFGSTWVSAFQAGRFLDIGASDIGFATSSDHGHSFVDGFLPGVTAFSDPVGPYDQASDPSVAFDRRHHVWLISYLAVHNATAGSATYVDVLVSRSGDGVEWDLPVPVARLDTGLDKNWTVCDNSPPSPLFGSCYTAFDIPALTSLLLVSSSSDGGLSWGAPVVAGNGVGAQPLVQPGGRVVMPFEGGLGPGCDQPTTPGHAQVCAVSSTDGGASWSAPVVVSALTFHRTAPRVRTPPLPSAEADRDGRIYVVWKDCRFEPGCAANDLVLGTSDDGASWSEVRRIPLDPIASNVDHFVPGIGVDPASAGREARLALTYYFLPDAGCTLAPCDLEVGFASSTDGGQSWSPREVVAGPMQLGWLAQTTAQGRMVGDYISTSVPNGGALALPAFAVASAPDDAVCGLGTQCLHEAIFTARERIRGGGIPAEADGATADAVGEDTP